MLTPSMLLSVCPSEAVDSSATEIDHDLEVGRQGEPKAGALLELASDHPRLFKLAREERLDLVERGAFRELIFRAVLA